MARLDGNPTLLNALHNNTPFVYAHLVKFERPTATPVAGSMGVFSLDRAENYAYFSDAAFDIVFDDGSFLVEPSDIDLENKLKELNYI